MEKTLQANPLLISVVVPVYKVEAYLEKCVRSLLQQTYPNLEIVLVDDGSPDNCGEICDRFSEEDSRVHAYHKVNGGLSRARNFGVEKALGEWIVFVDSDDYVEPDYVSDLWSLKDRFDADMVVTRIAREFAPPSKPAKKDKQFADFCTDSESAFFEIYKGGRVSWGAYGKLIKKSVLLQHPFPDGLYEDCACMYKLLEACEKIAIGDYVWNYHYVYRQGSILRKDLDEKHYRSFDICRELEDYIQETYPHMQSLSAVIYQRAVVQMLNLQTMSWKCFREVFLKYRKLFRKNFREIMLDPRYSIKTKYFFIFLCTTPRCYWLQKKARWLFR